MARIAVDAMGGDHAPHAPILGAVEAVKRYGVEVFLVGRKRVIEKELSKWYTKPRTKKKARPSITVIDAPETVEMTDPASIALRRKTKASIRIASDLVRKGEAVAVVSAGHTGAVMATTKMVFGVLEGIQRPALAMVMPSAKKPVILIDVGANVDCKPRHLVDFAIMGHCYAKEIFKNDNPKVCLLSIGEEDSKGNELVLEAHSLLKKTSMNFVGNIDGKDLMSGEYDVVVTDGFVGNVALKVAESTAEYMSKLLSYELRSTPITRIGAALSMKAFKALKARIDYSNYGGAYLLGAKGITVVGHGKSSPRAITNAIKVAHEIYESKVNERIQKMIVDFKV
ncbi:MAG: phosphate acyltransferase PlsX [Acidobacteria bacterium]|nr:phosphate acyltransferase PlsX [Acidobacteriota bacterium]